MAKKFWAGDCEADPFKFGRVPKPFLWGFYDGVDYIEFEKTEDAVQFMKNQDAIFFFHNGGKFDFHFIAKHFNRLEKCLMIHNRLVQAKMGKAELRDSYALLPFALKQYNKTEIDYKKLEKNVRKKHWKEIQSYLKDDCVYLYELISAFFNDHGRHLTAASAAIKELCKIENIKIENSKPSFFHDLQKFYYGGRCECIRAGEFHEPLTYLDINSAYPDAMLNPHPIGTSYEIKYDKNPKIIGQNFYTIRAKSRGALCRRVGGGLVFDWDNEERIYNTTGWEILAGMETRRLRISDHVSQICFNQHKDFSKFVWYFWGIRNQFKKGTTENLFAKLFLNSAYGKMAANPENYETYIFTDPALAQFMTDAGWDIRGETGGNLLVSKPLEENDMRYYNVATGASITGFVRAKLLRALHNVERPIYCDTDSIIFAGGHSLPLSDDLGSWKLEGEFTEGFFAGKKLYGVRNKKEEPKIATKGSRLEYDDIKRITRGKTVEFNKESPTFSWSKPEAGFITRKIKKTAKIPCMA